MVFISSAIDYRKNRRLSSITRVGVDKKKFPIRRKPNILTTADPKKRANVLSPFFIEKRKKAATIQGEK